LSSLPERIDEVARLFGGVALVFSGVSLLRHAVLAFNLPL
jgi:hypothetical protein